MTKMSSMIEVIDLYKSFDGQEVLRGINLTLAKGEIMALIGGSGKGKTVLLKNIIGLTKPDKGTVLIDGEDIYKKGGKDLDRIRSRFGFLFQGGALFDSMTVFDNVAFPLREKTRIPESTIKEKVIGELSQLGLKGMEKKFPAELSGGMKKRVALARAIIMDPEIMLFDEPTTGLDPVITNTIHRLVRDAHSRLHFTALIVSHEIPEIFGVVDKVAFLHNGQILTVGTPQEIQSSSNEIVMQFISGLPEGPIIHEGE